MSERLFGTDGIRGRAGQPPLDEAALWRIGRALAQRFAGTALIGRDTRLSGVWIEEVLKSSMQSAGMKVDCVGVLTTPGTAFLTRSGSCCVGVVISASHNPFQDNGIKIFRSDGQKLDERTQQAIEKLVEEVPLPELPARIPSDPPLKQLLKGARSRIRPYLDFLVQAAESPSGALERLKIVLDCANGAAFRIAPQVFRRLGAQLVTIHAQPDGTNINRGCGALHPQAMARRVVESGADLGAAFDGDADRVIFADRQGRLLDGDHILLLLARHLKRTSRLPTATVVTTVMANMGLEAALHKEGIGMLRTQVGDRWVWESMHQGGHGLGGEQSGHIILGDQLPAGDGILIAVKVASLVASGEVSLTEVRKGLIKYPQLLLNVPVCSKPDFHQIPSIRSEMRRIEGELKDQGRILIRYSGTEPLVRIMLEAQHGIDPAPYAESLAARFREALGQTSPELSE